MIAMRKRLQGIAFLAVLATLLGLAVATYVGVFEDGVPVTLEVDRAGSQLSERSDVKVRGLIVGQVQSISTEGAAAGATAQLQLDPAMVDMIPAGVSARLLPKTLFGETYVDLVLPEGVNPVGGVATPIAAGDVIPEDRSETARELETALDGLLPLLQAVEPQDLATTLGTLSLALEGRGADLGDTLVRFQELTSGFEPAIPDLQADITELADFSANLADAAPDLLDALEDFAFTARTVVEQRENLRALFTGVTTASDDLRAFLDQNRENLVGLAAASRPTLESLARYSPEFPCLFGQLAGLIPVGNQAFGVGTDKPGIYITLEIVNNRGKYEPNQDEPEYNDDRGPRCYPIVVPGPQYPPDGPFKDGSTSPPPPDDTPSGDPEDFDAETFGTGAASYDGMGVANSPGEQQVMAELIAAQNGGSPESVPGWSTMLVGPLYRGSQVTLT
jgi:phospholipid/cholesterol/gamma-HCH transport system substrate-binding protein